MGYWRPRTLSQGERDSHWGENEKGRERMGEAAGRQEMEDRLIQRSLEDESFRQRLLADPKRAVEEELGTRLPEDLQVVAVEETADTAYLVLPSRSTEAQEAGELSNRDLEAVAGGWEQVSSGFPTEDRCGCAL